MEEQSALKGGMWQTLHKLNHFAWDWEACEVQRLHLVFDLDPVRFGRIDLELERGAGGE